MDKKQYIKKGGLVVLSTSILFSNVGLALGEDYKLNNSVQVYKEAKDAKNRENSLKTLPKGNYFIYKKHDGMINITKSENVPGGWINPIDNIKDNIDENEPEVYNNNLDNKYILNNDINGYISSYDAIENRNSVGIYSAGEYHIYREYNGMVNITKDSEKPGFWINPKDNKNGQIIFKKNIEDMDSFILQEEVEGYMNSDDAKHRQNSVVNVYKGEYQIYRKYNGMINITKDLSSPGVWINPEKATTNANTEKKLEDNQKSLIIYNLKIETKGYISAYDAVEKINDLRLVVPGNYYVYKSFNGMLNLSKVADEPGIWINPSDNMEATKQLSYLKLKNENTNKLTFNEVVDKVIENNITEKDLKTMDYDVESVKKSAVDKIVSNKKQEIIKISSLEIDKTVNETFTKTETVEEIIKETEKETVEETTKETEEQTAKEITIEAETVEEIIKETEEETVEEITKETEKETVEESNENNQLNNQDKYSKTFKLKEIAEAYLTIDDAKVSKNSITTFTEGIYYIYQEDGEMINITTIKGKPGLWINPNMLNEDMDLLSKENIFEEEKIILEDKISGYTRAVDAIEEKNKVTDLAPGEYYIYKTNSGVLNLTKNPGHPGVWVTLN